MIYFIFDLDDTIIIHPPNPDEMYKEEQSLFLEMLNACQLKHANDIWEAKKDLEIVEAAHISSSSINSMKFN